MSWYKEMLKSQREGAPLSSSILTEIIYMSILGGPYRSDKIKRKNAFYYA